jgi:tRNA(fMet)-specific endonuclease VapC
MLPLRIVLDTSAYSRFRAGSSAAMDHLASAEVAYMPTVVLGELLAGFALGGRRAENIRTLSEFLAEPFVEVTSVDREVSERYAELFAALRRAGTPLPTNDVWIAACTLTVGAHLVTFDQDFARVPGLRHSILV